MAYSKVQICNRALAKVGNYTILSLDDPSDTAVLLKSVYDIVRDAEISANRWAFAIERKALPALEDAPAFGYLYAYQLPVDCLRLLEAGAVWPTANSADYRFGPNAKWEVSGGAVLSNVPAPLPIRYIRRVEDPARYPAVFIESLACKLAIEICERLAGGSSRREMLWKEYDEAQKTARRVNAIQRAPEYLQDGAWMVSRITPTDGGTEAGGGW